MSTITETSQLDEEAQAFLPQQLEQDYLSCLLAEEAIEVNDDAEITASGSAEPEPCQEDEPENDSLISKDKTVIEDESLLADDCSMTEDIVDNKINDAVTNDRVILTDNGVSNNEASNKTSIESYMSVEKLSSSTPFVCQLMLISGVKFAVPLANFSRMITVPENVIVNSNMASACFGKFERQDKSFFLIALERIMQASNKNQSGVLNESDKIVLMENDGFGFICHQVLETVTISPEDVLWRDESSQRYWLAGMVKEAGFAVLDVKGILRSTVGKG